MTLLLLFVSAETSSIVSGVQFYDEVFAIDSLGTVLGSACNPLPAGISVAFYGGNTVSSESYTGVTGYTTVGGLVSVTLQPNQLYTTVFNGDQAPNVYGQFTTDGLGNATTPGLFPGSVGAPCSVIGYRSPSLSTMGYTFEEVNLWPSGWFSSSAKSFGGNAFAVAAGLGAMLGTLDYMGQAILSLMRLQTLAGALYSENTEFNLQGKYVPGIGILNHDFISSAIDSWAFDFFGDLWTRQAGMSDAQWVSLILATLQTPKTTLAGIQQILTAWAPWYAGSIGTGSSPSLGYDDFGGMDISIPPAPGSTPTYMDTSPGATGLAGRNIIVFDSALGAFPNPIAMKPPVLQSSATLNSYLPTALVPGQLAVYFQNPTNPDSSLAPVSISNFLLNRLVSNWKAAGVGYISGGIQYPCLFVEN